MARVHLRVSSIILRKAETDVNLGWSSAVGKIEELARSFKCVIMSV